MAISTLGASNKVYYTQKYTASSTFTLPSGYGVSTPLTVEAFVVGGGGGAAGSYNSTNYVFGGGGGGGGVRSDVLSLTADTAITVGLGGAAGQPPGTLPGFGGNGTTSGVGITRKNLWINPQCISSLQAGFYGSFNWMLKEPTAPLTGNASAGAISGLGFSTGATATNGPAWSQPHRVTTGTQYTFSMYAWATASCNLTIAANYFSTVTRAAAAVSSVNTGAVALSTSSWGSRPSLTFTVPANCDTVIFSLTGSANTTCWFSNIMLEAASSASTYADGDTGGYTWAGTKDGSETLVTAPLLAVAGGGGGGHVIGIAAATPSGANSVSGGLPGATSGGGASTPAADSTMVWNGGHGGGAGGNATAATFAYVGTAPTTSGIGPQCSNSPYGIGSAGVNNSSPTQVASHGAPGPGIGDYGKGGWGANYHGNAGNSANYGNPIPKYTIPNTGMGGSGPHGKGTLSALDQVGNPGADGVVILRYWA